MEILNKKAKSNIPRDSVFDFTFTLYSNQSGLSKTPWPHLLPKFEGKLKPAELPQNCALSQEKQAEQTEKRERESVQNVNIIVKNFPNRLPSKLCHVSKS